METPTVNPTIRLSNRQRDILRRLLADVQHGEASEPNDPLTPHCMAVRSLRGPGPKSAADSAAFSRALRRLARRGFIVLCNFTNGVQRGPNAGKVNIDPADKHARADHLLLTPRGSEVAGRIAAPVKPHLKEMGDIPSAASVPEARDQIAGKGPSGQWANNPLRPSAEQPTKHGPIDTPRTETKPAAPVVRECPMCWRPPPGDPDCPRCKWAALAKAQGAPWAT
jgi:hypothetical protein